MTKRNDKQNFCVSSFIGDMLVALGERRMTGYKILLLIYHHWRSICGLMKRLNHESCEIGRNTYHRTDPVTLTSIFLYYSKSLYNSKYWMIWHSLGSTVGAISNEYCGDLDYPANGDCNGGWLYASSKTFRWKYDSTMAIHCT